MKNLSLKDIRKHKLLNIVFWIFAIGLWPLSLSYFFYVKSRAITHKALRTTAFAGIAIFALVSSIAWAAAFSGSQQTPPTRPASNHTATITPSGSQQSQPSQQPKQQPAQSTQGIGSRTKTSGCVIAGALQDKACTPGAIFANVTKAQVCTSGYASSVRDVSESTKNAVYAEYGITAHTTGQYEVDHLVSLELGGSNDIANLWPEAASPTPGFHQKDVIENKLHDEVCNGTISLTTAQDEIASNWLALYNGTTPTTSSSPQTTQTQPTSTTTTTTTSGVVKLSTTGICHAPGDPYYDRTTNFTPYNTLQDCLNAGGRLPKN